MMKATAAALLATLLGPGFAAPALANGATASFPAGGVVFHPEPRIAIAREDLDLGLARIRVRYVFRSTAKRPLRLTIGFPLARVDLGDGPDALNLITAATTDPRNYMDFTVTAGGKALRPRLHEYAWKDGKNITARLRALHVPPFAIGSDSGEYPALRNLPHATLATLEKEGLVERVGGELSPLWSYQSVLEWHQTFPPGESTVDISYAPLVGDDTAANLWYQLLLGDSGAGYCFDEGARRQLKAGGGKKIFTEPLTLDYILTTANNWNGPIGRFRLTITNPHHYPFSFCPPEGLARAGGGAGWEARNFTPRADLRVVFFPGESP